MKRYLRRWRILAGAALTATFLASALTGTLARSAPLAIPSEIGRLPTDQAPLGLDVDEVTNRVWVANYLGQGEQGSYSVVDAATGNVVANVPVQLPQDVVVNNVTGKAYIAKAGDEVAVVTRENPGTIAKRIAVAKTPKWMTVNELRNLIYVANHEGFAVQVIDGNSDTIIATISLGDRNPVQVAVDIAGNRLYVTAFQNEAGRVAVFDATTYARLNDLQVQGDQFEVTVDQDTGRVFVVANRGVGFINAFDRNGTKLRDRQLCTRMTGAVFNRIAGHLWVSCEYQDPINERSRSVSVLDRDLNDVANFQYGDWIPGPAMAVDEARNRVYVGNTYGRIIGGHFMRVFQDDGGSAATATPTTPATTATPTVTPSPTATNSPTATATRTPTVTPSPTATPQSMTIPPSGTVVPTTDGATFTFPAGVFTTTVSLNYQPRQPVTAPSEGLFPSNRAFELSAVAANTSITTTTTPFTISLLSNDAYRGSVISSTQQLFRFNPSKLEYTQDGISNVSVDPTTGQLTARSTVFGLFAVFGQSNRAYLPALARSSIAGGGW